MEPMEMTTVSVDDMPMTKAAQEAGGPWIGVLAKEQIDFQIKNNGADMAPELRSILMENMDRIGMIVENMCVVTLANGSPIYGFNNPTDDDLFMFLITDKSQAVVSGNDLLHYRHDKPPFPMDDTLWPIIVDTINDIRTVHVVPMLIGWRLGEEATKQIVDSARLIKKFGNTPCVFVFAVRKDKYAGGVVTMVSLPPSVQRMSLLAGEVAGHA